MVKDEWKVKLHLDAIYYYSACEHCELAKKNYKPLKEIIDEIVKIDNIINDIENTYENKLDAYDEVESYCIQLDSYYSQMKEKYLPVIKSLVLIHIFTALSLEAYINIIASENISTVDEFDQLNIQTKWLLLPILMGNEKTFNKGEEPYQSFSKIIKWRNKLVHFKGKTDEWKGYLPPEFFKPLGLTIEDAEKSCSVVPKMIKKLCSYCNISEPKWLTKNLIWSSIKTSINPA